MERSFLPIGDCGIRISFGNEVSPTLNRKIINYKTRIETSAIKGIIEVVQGYSTLTVYYEPYANSYEKMCTLLDQIIAGQNQLKSNQPIIYHIPTCYEEPFNLDLTDVAEANCISEEEVVMLHSNKDYFIYMLGFLPGFPYLGGLDKRIATPRLKSPRLNVPSGSVGIAGEQTGVYPFRSPGGWRIIGRTPLRFFDVNRNEPFLLTAGNYVRFQPISYNEYTEIEHEVVNGTFQVKTTKYKGESR